MKIRKSIVAAAAAAVVGTTGALALPAVASAHNASTTVKFTAVLVKGISFTNSTLGRQETDVNSKGKTIGFDVGYAAFTGPKSGTVNAAFDIKGGLLYATVTTTNGGKTFSGTVTGGTGAFTGAAGTVAAKTTSSTKTAITITYST
jgi:hypothetical protein